jgi:hypothetical protein
MGFAFMLTVWGYHIGYYPHIHPTVTYMLTGMCGGIMLLGTLICRLKIISIKLFYESEESDEDAEV